MDFRDFGSDFKVVRSYSRDFTSDFRDFTPDLRNFRSVFKNYRNLGTTGIKGISGHLFTGFQE